MKQSIRRSTPAIVLVGLLFGSSITVRAQDFSKAVELDGKSARAVILATRQMLKTSPKAAALMSTYSVNVRGAGLVYHVDFSNDAIQKSKRETFEVDVNGAHVRQVLAGADQHIPTVRLHGDYALSLSFAEAAWKKTRIGHAADIKETKVGVSRPFPEAPQVYWIGFAPPEPARHGLTVGCGLLRSFAVDLKKNTVTPLKPVC